MEDTIAAVATPLGEGGIGIIRISGENAYKIISKIFRNPQGKTLEGRRLTYGHIIDPENGKVKDEVLAVYMKAPHTYTVEDVVEINCHGGIIPLRNVLSLVLKHGARPAEPGEFTKRAFLNGRLDLSQAESITDIIGAKTEKSFDAAMENLSGGLSEKISGLREKILNVLMNITVNIDYPDEDIEEITYDNLGEELSEIEKEILFLIESGKNGKILRDGINIAIVGKPNVGKSSLMNNFLRQQRSIVTEIPGTTRDTIEEYINIEGIPVKIIDTAGIRNTEDIIEKIGIEKSRKTIEKADIVIFIIDGAKSLEEEDRKIFESLDKKKSLILINKSDMENVIDNDFVKKLKDEYNVLNTSMKNHEDTLKIEKKIAEMIFSGNVNSRNSEIITNARQEDSLYKALEFIREGKKGIEMDIPLEIIEIDIRNTYEHLGFITGDCATADIIDRVFSNFCLGK